MGRGQWHLDCEDQDTWHDAGETVKGIPAGNHVITYRGMQGFSAPSAEIIKITAGKRTAVPTRSYTTPKAVLRVTLTGLADISKGGWGLEENPAVWNASGDVEAVDCGSYVIYAKPVEGYAVSPVLVTVADISTVEQTLAYQPEE